MSRRRLWLLLIAVVVVGSLVAAIAALRDRFELEVAATAADDRRAAGIVENVVDSSLEELRLRESARPFDHYNPVYRPEGVVAASDALAPSPLSRAPDDERLLGWAQLNPDGTTTMPFSSTRPEVAAALSATLSTSAFAPLRERTRAPKAPLVAAVAPAPERQRSSPTSSARTRVIAPPDDGSATSPLSTSSSSSSPSSSLLAMNANTAPPPQQQGVVQQLNVASADVYSKLQQAEAVPAQRAALASNSKLPAVVRNDVDDGEARSKTKSGKKPKSKAAAFFDDDIGAAEKPAMKRGEAPKPKPTPRPKPVPVAAMPSPTPALTVDYTPMLFDSSDGQLLLQRTVTTSDGAATVQLAIFDDAATRAWLDKVVARRVPTTVDVQIVSASSTVVCSLRAPVSTVIDDVELCFSTPAPSPPWAQLAVMLTLLILVLVVLVVLDRAAERADVLARQRAAFVSSVSHELRTPLTTLRMHAELLRDGLIADVDQQKRFLDEMVGESVRLSHLVENVLEAQRLEEGRRPLRLITIDVADVVAEVADGQRGLLDQRGFALELQIADDLSLRGAFDRQAIEQIVVNLVENAVKYAHDATDRRIGIGVREDRGNAVVVVADRGPGIPKHERERVFARFARIERADEAHIAGSGLGLALVRELATAHGGSARVIDSVDGCSVEVRLPLRSVGG